MAAQEIIPSGIAKDATLEILQEVLLVLTELNAKAPRLDIAGRAVVNLADAGAAITLQANQNLANIASLTALNGYGGGTLVISATQAAIAEMQQAELQFLQLITLV